MINVVEITPPLESLNSSISSICALCSRKFPNSGALNFHRVRTHKILSCVRDTAILERARLSETLRFFCPVDHCKYNKDSQLIEGLQFKKHRSLNYGEGQETNLTFFKSKASLQQHFDKVHRDKTLPCCKCHMKFSLESYRRAHEKTYHGIVDFNKDKPAVRNEISYTIIHHQPDTNCSADGANAARPSDAIPCKKRFRPIAPKLPDRDKIRTRDVSSQTYEFSERNSKSVAVQTDKRSKVNIVEPFESIDTLFPRFYDESACQTVRIEAFGAGVQFSAPSADIFCQTVEPTVQDVSVFTDSFFFDGYDNNVKEQPFSVFESMTENEMAHSSSDALWMTSDDGDDVSKTLMWCTTETQTAKFWGSFEQQSIETQTHFSSPKKSFDFTTAETQT